MNDSLDRNWLTRFRKNLRTWYGRNARDLPWRRTGDAYRIWISEIMLQQTTVAAVIPYYQRFMKRFPTVRKLASAPENEVLRYWEGLGYYSRARNIHKTAKLIVADHRGRFPEDVDRLQKLPGIGKYTAGAIASFAFDQRAAILEANTLRLYCRLIGYDADPRSSQGQRRLWEFADEILPRQSVGRFNQALMELGGMVCMPVNPNCPKCPVRSCCKAFADATQAEIPIPPKRAKIESVTEAAIAIRQDNSYLLRRCGEKERWSGLWDFPRFTLDEANGAHLTSRNAIRKRTQSNLETVLFEETGIATNVGSLALEIKHSVTRFRIRLLCFLADYQSGSPNTSVECRWVAPEDFEKYPLSVTGRKFAELLKTRDATASAIPAC